MNANNLFGNMQFVPGVGYVQSPSAQRAASSLGDDGAVMMISGLGSSAQLTPEMQEEARRRTLTAQTSYSGATIAPTGPMQQPITLFNVTLPLWAWLAIAAVLGGAGGYYLRGRLR